MELWKESAQINPVRLVTQGLSPIAAVHAGVRWCVLAVLVGRVWGWWGWGGLNKVWVAVVLMKAAVLATSSPSHPSSSRSIHYDIIQLTVTPHQLPWQLTETTIATSYWTVRRSPPPPPPPPFPPGCSFSGIFFCHSITPVGVVSIQQWPVHQKHDYVWFIFTPMIERTQETSTVSGGNDRRETIPPLIRKFYLAICVGSYWPRARNVNLCFSPNPILTCYWVILTITIGRGTLFWRPSPRRLPLLSSRRTALPLLARVGSVHFPRSIVYRKLPHIN